MKLATKVYEEAAKKNQADSESKDDDKKDDKDDVQEASYEEK